MDEQAFEEFLDAVEKGDLDMVRSLLDANPQWANADITSHPLHRVNHADMARLLLEHGADVNIRGYDDMTPLHECAKEGKADPVPVLIEFGADLNAVDEYGYTPLAWATREPFEGREITRLLLEAGAEYDIVAAAALGDLQRVRDILKQDPEAVRKVPSAEVLLLGVYISENGNVRNRVPVLRLLLEHRPQVTRQYLLGHEQFCDSRPDHQEIAQVFREYADLFPES